MRRTFLAALAFSALAFAAGHWLSRADAQQQPAQKPAPGHEVATFAGGCFWCVEADFDKVPGVVATVSGYMGGKTPNPTYKQVTAGGTGHLEVLQVTFDPQKVSYRKLVDYFWKTIDPHDADGQFCDKGESYTTAIFTHTPEQKAAALASKADVEKSGILKQPIVTTIRDAGPFTTAEDYHQDYYQKNPLRYSYYRHGCGRDARLEQIWGKKQTN